MRYAYILLLSGLLLSPWQLSAQQKWGRLSASLESNEAYYLKDSLLADGYHPEKPWAANNYLKLDYQWKFLSAGLQAEAYTPALSGYPSELHGCRLPYKYIGLQFEGLQITLGDFYEQWGHGLVLRAWEDRNLGLNTALEGGRIAYAFRDIFTLKGIIGRPRLYMRHAKSWLKGVDASVNLSAIFGWTVSWDMGGSFLNKYEAVPDESLKSLGINANVNTISARTGIEWQGLTLSSEAVFKDSDPARYNSFGQDKGRALLVEAGYATQGLSALAAFRWLSHMESHSMRDGSGIFDQVNYLPALTQQHTYQLASLHPYQTQAFDEIGMQADIYYSIRRGKTLHLNFSNWEGKESYAPENGRQLLFREIALDFESRWNRALKSVILYSWQRYNPVIHGYMPEQWDSHIAVADVGYKIDKKHSLRVELQHCYTRHDAKSWAGGLLEYQMAPAWTFHIADWWNYGSTRKHYPQAGVSFSYAHLRASLGYGRYMAGYQCSGGVCRLLPAYKGFNFSLTVQY